MKELRCQRCNALMGIIDSDLCQYVRPCVCAETDRQAVERVRQERDAAIERIVALVRVVDQGDDIWTLDIGDVSTASYAAEWKNDDARAAAERDAAAVRNEIRIAARLKGQNK